MSATYCPFCSEVLFDPQLERCPTCGMFVPPEVQAFLRARLETQQHSQPQSQSPKSPRMDQPSGASSSTRSSYPVDGAASAVDGDQEIPVAFAFGQAGRENPHVGRSLDMNLYNPAIAATDAQAQLVVWRRIFLHSGIGLAIWSLATLPLGKWGLLPLAFFPASLSIFVCLLSLGSSKRRDLGLAVAAMSTALLALALGLMF